MQRGGNHPTCVERCATGLRGGIRGPIRPPVRELCSSLRLVARGPLMAGAALAVTVMWIRRRLRRLLLSLVSCNQHAHGPVCINSSGVTGGTTRVWWRMRSHMSSVSELAVVPDGWCGTLVKTTQSYPSCCVLVFVSGLHHRAPGSSASSSCPLPCQRDGERGISDLTEPY